MKAMILAAGLGTRLRPLTERVPKPLVPVGGRPLIEYPLRLLRASGVDEVVINVHHHAAALGDALGDGSRFGLRIHYSVEDSLLDTGGGVLHARAWLDRPFFILNADSIHDVPLDEVALRHRRHGGIATLVLRPDPAAERYGLLHYDGDMRIRRFRGEPAVEVPNGGAMMYAGVSLWEPRIFDHMPGGAFSLTRDVLPRLLAAGEPFFAFAYGGYWRVVDTPADLDRARREIAGGQVLSYLVPQSS